MTEQSAHKYIFRYNDSYFNNTSYPPLSLTLPKLQQEYISPNLFPFFINLLPEGTNRKTICRFFMIDEKDFFGILMATDNMDIIGNVSIKVVK